MNVLHILLIKIMLQLILFLNFCFGQLSVCLSVCLCLNVCLSNSLFVRLYVLCFVVCTHTHTNRAGPDPTPTSRRSTRSSRRRTRPGRTGWPPWRRPTSRSLRQTPLLLLVVVQMLLPKMSCNSLLWPCLFLL
jgi:hypothetical protein